MTTTFGRVPVHFQFDYCLLLLFERLSVTTALFNLIKISHTTLSILAMQYFFGKVTAVY